MVLCEHLFLPSERFFPSIVLHGQPCLTWTEELALFGAIQISQGVVVETQGRFRCEKTEVFAYQACSFFKSIISSQI